MAIQILCISNSNRVWMISGNKRGETKKSNDTPNKQTRSFLRSTPAPPRMLQLTRNGILSMTTPVELPHSAEAQSLTGILAGRSEE